MATAEALPPDASTASTGPTLRYIGEWAYAFSGLISVDNNETTLLEFINGSNIFSGELQFFYASSSTDAYNYIVYFNNLEVVHYRVFGSTDTNGEHQLPASIPILIPPFTVVKATSTNIGSTNSSNQMGNLIGRVYA